MHEKLTPEQQQEILEAGIRVFANSGYEKARMQDIAAEAKLSVGVLYNYYANKETLFDACLEHGLSALEGFLADLAKNEQKPLDYGRTLIRSVVEHSARFSDTVRLYHEITCTRDDARAKALANRIESMTGRLYGEIIARAQAAGDVRSDLDPNLFALFLDNLLMMMQFTYCTPYYRERYRLFVGGDIAADGDRVADQLLKFLESAFTLEQKDIKHRG